MALWPLNLTKGITETLEKTVHNRNVPRLSRYRDAEIVNNREPFSNEEEPTVPPGLHGDLPYCPRVSAVGSLHYTI